MSTEVTAGTFVGGYRVVSLIGSGAMGSVFLAEDTVRGGKVALKVLVPELDRDDRFRRRLLQESKLVASLDHPHIVPTLESGDVEGRLFLAMACVEGSDLRELLRQEGSSSRSGRSGCSGRSRERSMPRTPPGWSTAT